MLSECNTWRQPFMEPPKRPKRRQMLAFFASPRGCRVPDCSRVNEFRCSRLSLALGGAEIGLILKSNGDRHEENRLVSNGAGNGIGIGFCCGSACEGCQSAATGSVRSLGSRLRQRDHERLHLPRCDAVQPQPFGGGLFRAAL